MSNHIETKCIHGNLDFSWDEPTKAVSFPIYQTATFGHIGLGHSTGFDYTREKNPTRQHLEEILTALEGAYDTTAFSSGMAAVTAVFDLFAPGDHVICSEDLYGGVTRLVNTIGKKNGLMVDFVNTGDLDEIKRVLRPETKALYIETPSNPTMQVTDLAKMRELADQYHLLLIVDNTFLSPYLQNPLSLGADIVVHSGTKYLGGHNDTLAGFLVTNREDLDERLRFIIKTNGTGLAPFDSWLILRGIKTLGIRMERAQENAIRIAGWLKEQPLVAEVIYPGLEEHPGHEIMKKQARGFGAMLTFQMKEAEDAREILNRVRMIKFAESLGGVETLITYPVTQTHADVPKEIREKNGITECTLRLSVGIENAEDLIGELEQVFQGIEGERNGRTKS